MRLTVIGCSSGLPDPHKACSAYLVQTNESCLLLDAGEGLSAALRRCRIDPRVIDTIFISHTHSDHIMGLPLYLQMCYILKRSEPLSIYLPEEAVDSLGRLLRMAYLFPDKIGFPLEILPVGDKLHYHTSGVSVTSCRTSHLRGNAPFLIGAGLTNRMQCYAYRIESEGKTVVYSADLGDAADLDPILPNADLLIAETMHIDTQRLADLATVAGVKAVLITHVNAQADQREAIEAFQKAGIASVKMASEGLVWSL